MDRRTVLVHGAGGGAWEWGVWQRVLAAAGLPAAAVDLAPAGTGLAATRLADYVSQVEAVVRSRSDAGPPVLVGASLGGLIAAMLARPLGAAALVLVNPLPPAPWHAGLPPREDKAAVIPWGRDASLAGTRRALFDADEATALFASTRWRDESAAVMRDARAGVVIEPELCPTLFLVSGRDEDVPATTSLAWAAAWNASVLRFPHASHVGPLLGRDAVACAKLVVEWLRADVPPFPPSRR